MNIFISIEPKLDEFARKLHTKVVKKSLLLSGIYPVKIKGRNIFWNDLNIHKGIIIQPHLTSNGEITGLWDFDIIAWNKNQKTEIDSDFWQYHILKAVDFHKIETEIDNLLYNAKMKLSMITSEDL